MSVTRARPDAAPARTERTAEPAVATARARCGSPADWVAQLARCSPEYRRARVSAVGNRGMARIAAHPTLARAPISEKKPDPTVTRFAEQAIEELRDDPNLKLVLSLMVNAAKRGELPYFASLLKNAKHPVYGDCFIAMASEFNDFFSSKVTVGLFKIMADQGVDIVGLMGTYSLDPLAKVAAFKSLVEDFREMLEYGDISEEDAKAVRSLISDAENALRSIEGTWHKPAQPRLMAAAAAAWVAVGALAGDDVTVVGIADDVAIPFVVVGAVALSIAAAFSGRKPEILNYAPALPAVTAAVRQMSDLTALTKAMQTARGNVADTGVMKAAEALLAATAGLGLCAALQILLDQASRAGNKDQMRKIRATQKAKGCRHSRSGG